VVRHFCAENKSRDFQICDPQSRAQLQSRSRVHWELEVAPPEGLSAWDASRAEQAGCRVAVPNTEGSGWVGEKEFKQLCYEPRDVVNEQQVLRGCTAMIEVLLNCL